LTINLCTFSALYSAIKKPAWIIQAGEKGNCKGSLGDNPYDQPQIQLFEIDVEITVPQPDFDPHPSAFPGISPSGESMDWFYLAN